MDARSFVGNPLNPLPHGLIHHALVRNWWAVALRGVCAIVFGMLAFLLPLITSLTLVILFAAYMLLDGAFAIVAGVHAVQHHERWWSFALEGVTNLVAGLIAILWPAIAIFALVYLVGLWAIATGAMMVAGAFLRRRPEGHWMLVLNGLLSIALGVVLIVWPTVAVVALAWWIGAYALIFGAVLLAFSFRLRRHQRLSAARAHR